MKLLASWCLGLAGGGAGATQSMSCHSERSEESGHFVWRLHRPEPGVPA
jgi:hypothetical protein